MKEPDLKPLYLSDEYINKVSLSVGELPEQKRERYRKDYKLSEFDVTQLTTEKDIALWFEQAVKMSKAPKKVANWILTNILSILNEKRCSINELKIKPSHITSLVNLVEDGKIGSNQAKEVFEKMVDTGDIPENIVKNAGLARLDDSGAIELIVKDVLEKNKVAIDEYKKGKTNVFGWLVGQVMKASKGKANPTIANNLVSKYLE